MKQQVKNFIKYRHLLYELVSRDIKVKYKNSFLGILWSMLNPLFMMIVLTIVFSAVFKNKIPNFPVYCLTGRLMYSFFSEATRFCMNSISKGGGLIRKVYIPKYLFPLSKVLSSFVTFLISLVPLFLVMIVTGVSFSKTNILIIFPLIYVLLISLGIGLIISTITVFFRDMEHLYSIILMIVMYMTPIFYPVDIISKKYLPLIKLNPIFECVKMFREVMLYGNMPTINSHLICLTYSIFYLLLGLLIFYKKQDKFIFHI